VSEAIFLLGFDFEFYLKLAHFLKRVTRKKIGAFYIPLLKPFLTSYGRTMSLLPQGVQNV
jgi:hypothetical protein